jgi:protocatechuate 3,4-dioxygenase beta subunit
LADGIRQEGDTVKKTIIASLMATSLLLLFSALVLAAPAPQFGNRPKADNTRLLTGKVLDHSDNPLPNAVVYLTNTRTRAVKTYIVSQDGTYRFPSLQPNIDYEVYAQHNGHKSDSKTVSQFDDRPQVLINLKIDTKQ